MGVSATGTASVNTARKVGKRYTWGAERPGVIEKRVQLRKDQIDLEIASIREDGEREIARRIAVKEAEKKKLADQEALVAEHRKALKERRRAFRVANSYIVPKGDFSVEQVAAIKALYPGIDDEEAHFLLSKRARENAEAGSPGAALSEGTGASGSTEAKAPVPASESRAQPVATPVQASTDMPKPAPIHIEASVAVKSDSSDARGERPVTDGGDRDWSDFDPDAWEEGQDYPEHLYCAVQDRDRDYYLVPRMDLDEAVEPEPPEAFRELRQRERELENALDALIEKHGKNSMVWSQEVADEFARLDRAVIQVGKEIDLVLAARSPSGVC